MPPKKKKRAPPTFPVAVFFSFRPEPEFDEAVTFQLPAKILPPEAVKIMIKHCRDELRRMSNGLASGLHGKDFEDFLLAVCDEEGTYEEDASLVLGTPVRDQVPQWPTFLSLFENPSVVKRRIETAREARAMVERVRNEQFEKKRVELYRAQNIVKLEQKEAIREAEAWTHAENCEDKLRQSIYDEEEEKKVARTPREEVQAAWRRRRDRKVFREARECQERRKMQIEDLQQVLFQQVQIWISQEKDEAECTQEIKEKREEESAKSELEATLASQSRKAGLKAKLEGEVNHAVALEAALNCDPYTPAPELLKGDTLGSRDTIMGLQRKKSTPTKVLRLHGSPDTADNVLAGGGFSQLEIAERSHHRPYPAEALEQGGKVYTFHPRAPPLHRLPPVNIPEGALVEVGKTGTFVRHTEGIRINPPS